MIDLDRIEESFKKEVIIQKNIIIDEIERIKSKYINLVLEHPKRVLFGRKIAVRLASNKHSILSKLDEEK